MEHSCEHCDRQVYAKGLCSPHYQRLAKYGNPLAGTRPVGGASTLERILSNLDVGDCWEWKGSFYDNGYGQISLVRNGKKTTRPVHRELWEQIVGPVEDGLELDHLCRNRKCANPDHLEPVTAAENVRRSEGHQSKVLARRSHCKNGHEFNEDNGHAYEYKPGKFRRHCKVCNTERARERRLASRTR